MRFIIEEKYEGEMGQVLIVRIGRGWILTDLYVNPEYRGKGHSNQLMKKALSWADRHGHRLSLRVCSYGKGLLVPSWELTKFYKRYGFVEKGNRMVRLSKERSVEDDNYNEIPKEHRGGSRFAIYPAATKARKG